MSLASRDDRHLDDLVRSAEKHGEGAVYLLVGRRYVPGVVVEVRPGLAGLVITSKGHPESDYWTPRNSSVVGVPIESVRTYLGRRLLGIA